VTTAQVFCELPDGRTLKVGEVTFAANAGGYLTATTFVHASQWLEEPSSYDLSAELPRSRGPLTYTGERLVPGPLADTGPDQWGRNLLFTAERKAAKKQGRQLRTLHEGHFLLLARDLTRQGALRFSMDGGDTFVADALDGVPTLIELDRLVDAAERQVGGVGTDADLDLLMRAGSSAGGARPKATVRLADGRLALAKFPSPADLWDVQAWEATALELARRAKVETPPFRLHRLDKGRSVLLVERFDRTPTGRRGYLSAHSLLEQTTATRVTYLELVDALADVSANPQVDRTEMFRRIALSLMVHNVDDHMKNHGLLRTERGWRLSPVFDVNPFPAGQSVEPTSISGEPGSLRDVLELLGVANHFGLDQDSAAQIVTDVEVATRDWAQVAAQNGIEEPEEAALATAFDTEARHQALRLATTAGLDGPTARS
jgi:serine/threonine-protein kinase HipA